MKNNLFYYATSELSQDAFICYLLSFAFEKFMKTDKALNNCAKELLGIMLEREDYNSLVVTDIKKQYKNIDVLVELNDGSFIIIEDKTFGSQSNDQINRYRKTLIEEGVPKDKIFCVYYKIVEQDHPEENIVNITRADLLKIFAKYPSENLIYNHYAEYLKYIDEDANAFKSDFDIENWRSKYSHVYGGFFTHLINSGIVKTFGNKNDYGWHYVNNKRGGVWVLWWSVLSDVELENMGIGPGPISKLYLQIEDNHVAVKLRVLENSNRETIKHIRSLLANYFVENVQGFFQTPLRYGKTLTVGRIQYDMDNYKNIISLMENTLKKAKKELEI